MTSKEESQLRVERVDDIPVIYGLLEQMGIRTTIDCAINPHKNWSGMSPGWVMTIWLVHILSEQNHLMEPVQQWVARHLYILRELTGEAITERDFTDDRLAICLRELSKTKAWQELEERLSVNLIRVYELKPEVVRLDATTNTVYHDPEKGEMFEKGKAKNGLYETQFKTMMASLDPLGLPLAVDIVPGNRADDPLYIPSYQRVKKILNRNGLVIVGDSKMSALLTRGTIAAGEDYYLVPLADKKDDPGLKIRLLEEWLEGDAESTLLFLPEDRPLDGSAPDPDLAIADGFEVLRTQSVLVKGEEITWNERLLVVRSYSYQKSMLVSLYNRLEKAEAALVALTPPRQRGKKQFQEESKLLSAIDEIEKKYWVKGFFNYQYEKEIEKRTIRGYKGNPSREEIKIRYQLSVNRNHSAVSDAEFQAGWRIYATNQSVGSLSLEKAVQVYRGQIVQENIFRRFNGKMLSITPLYVQREDHAQGLVHLLTLGSRLLALGDFVAKKALAQEEKELAGVYSGNPKRSTARPTTERMLKAFEGIDLIISPHGARNKTILTGFGALHQRILKLLGLEDTLFSALQAV